MTVVSSGEFITNGNKYFNMAMREDVFVEKDDIMFIVTKANSEKKKYLEPDEDFRRAITAEELLKGIYEDIDKKYENRL